MKRIYVAPTLLDAQLAADALSSVGIATHILNANAAGALGELPFMHAQPEIWVDDDSQAGPARDALAALHGAPVRAEKPCARCGEINPGNFLSCWHCGATIAD